MPINPNIAMGYKAPEFDSPVNQLSQLMQMKQMQQANQLNQMKMDEYGRGIESNNRLQSILRGEYKTPEARQDAILKGGFLKEAQDYGKGNAEIAKQQAATQKDQLESAFKKLSLGAQLLSGAKDQASYDAARQTAIDNGLDVSRMPAQFDPAFVAQKLQEGQTMQEQVAQKWKAMEYTTPNANAVLSANTSTANNAATNDRMSREKALDRSVQLQGQKRVDDRARERIALEKTKTGGSEKPLPVGALKMRVEAQDAADTAEGINERLGGVEKKIKDGKLSFGPVSNLLNTGLNAAGMSTEGSRNLASFKSELEKLRNDSLRLNKGVQTDGDAQRAWNELFQNINDTELVKQRLSEIKQINARAKNLRLMEVDTIDRNYGRTGNTPPAKRSVLDEADAILNGG